MFSVTTKVKRYDDGLGKIVKALETLRKNDVLVGIPESANIRPDQESNAQLAAKLSLGDPLENLPPRPFLKPAIEHNLTAIQFMQQSAITTALNPATSARATASVKKLGGQTAKMVKAWFVDPANGWPANAPMTIRLKKSSQPNIDTGELRKSITYVIRPKS